MDKKQCYSKIKEQLQKIEELKKENPYSPKYKLWEEITRKILYECFDEGVIKKVYEKRVFEIPSSENRRYQLYLEDLEEKKQALESLIELLQDDDTINKVNVTKNFTWEYDLHNEIKSASQKLIEDKHYPQAVEEAFKRVIREVKKIVKNKTDRELDGDRLMNFAFGCENQEPVIKFNSLQTREERDEQKGIMYLFKGIVGIRNRKAHENVNLDDPQRAFEYLALTSLLMRLLDEYGK